MKAAKSSDYVDYVELLMAWPAIEFPFSESELVRQGYGAKKLQFDRRYRWLKRDLVDFIRRRGYPAATIDKFAAAMKIKLAPPYARKGRKS